MEKDNFNKSEIVKKLTPIVEKAAIECGVIPLEISFVKDAGRWFLRIFIYRKSPKVTHEDCGNITGILADYLDELIPVPYNLEVSSPGADRKLKSVLEYKIFKGERVKVKLKKNVERENKTFTAKIIEYDDVKGIILQESETGEKITVKIDEVSSVKLEPDYSSLGKQKSEAKRRNKRD